MPTHNTNNAQAKLSKTDKLKASAAWCALLVALYIPAFSSADDQPPTDVASLSLQLFSVQGDEKNEIVERLLATGDKSLIPTFVLAMRWTGNNQYIASALSRLTGTTIKNWHDAYRWQENHPEVTPHNSYSTLKLRFWGNTDQRLVQFFNPINDEPLALKIRLEEIVWGGVAVDGIPALETPQMITASKASYLLPDDLVFGININDDKRAYPLRILGWHEMLNDVIGGVPVSLTYCTLCGSGTLYETKPENMTEAFHFGTSGLLYRSNKLMYDKNTNSLWNQFTGKPVVGPLANTDIVLKALPMTTTSWHDWQLEHPATTVLSLNTGFTRDYQSGSTYKEYFASPDLMFPAVIGNEELIKRKDYVFGIRQVAAAKAWPLEAFRNTAVINDNIGRTPLVLIGTAKTRTVRAYRRDADLLFDEQLVVENSKQQLSSGSTKWIVHEDFLITVDGKQRLARLPGQLSYWFAWDNFLGFSSELYEQK